LGPPRKAYQKKHPSLLPIFENYNRSFITFGLDGGEYAREERRGEERRGEERRGEERRGEERRGEERRGDMFD
jgi:hypothetical protein